MIQALQIVLILSATMALLLACVVRAAKPGHLLDFLQRPWEWWLIYRPAWLPLNASGDCPYCTAFWLPGVPVALLAGLCTPAGWWALLAAPFGAFLFERLITR